MSDSESVFKHKLTHHLETLYPQSDIAALIEEIEQRFSGFKPQSNSPDLWTERDGLIITYGDTLKRAGQLPLETLKQFLTDRVGDAIPAVHILPFFPYSSDDGFSVIDYCQIDPELGDWPQIEAIAQSHRLMADLVINHTSAQSEWFKNFLSGTEPGQDYFIEADQEQDLSDVVRPRASPLLRHVETSSGLKSVWCTFSHDQVDLNFANPVVLLEFITIIRRYLDAGISVLRLDAIGYLWKQVGTSCIHLPETHEVVRLLRTVVDHFAPGTILITETNVPNHENLTYFGNSNEAHMIYNFSLAPLLLHALLDGTSKYLKKWLMSMPPAPLGCTYLNFTASHDGIGMRPAEGLLSESEQQEMTETIKRVGGHVSTRRMADGTERVYEMNIALFDALRETNAGPDDFQCERFLCSQTVMISLEGLPAFYIHSLLATPNNNEGVAETGRYRSINRKKLDYDELSTELDDPATIRAQIFGELLRRFRIRSQQSAFHPNATQFTLHLKSHFFGFWRQSDDRQHSIFCVANLSNQPQKLFLSQLNLISTDQWIDLLNDQQLKKQAVSIAFEPYQVRWISNRHAR